MRLEETEILLKAGRVLVGYRTILFVYRHEKIFQEVFTLLEQRADGSLVIDPQLYVWTGPFQECLDSAAMILRQMEHEEEYVPYEDLYKAAGIVPELSAEEHVSCRLAKYDVTV